MKNFNYVLLLSLLFSLLTLSSCEDDGLSPLETDIVGEWVVDDYIYSNDNIATDGTMQDMHMIFESDFDVEISWFEDGDFFTVDGSWEANEDDSNLYIDLEERVFFFCDDNDINLNIFFFAFDMELDTECNNGDWMEIQLERL